MHSVSGWDPTSQMAKKTQNISSRSNTVINSINTFKMIHIKKKRQDKKRAQMQDIGNAFQTKRPET